MVGLQRIRDYDAWARLAPEWSALCDRVPGSTPFQRPEWLLSWWKNWGSGDLYVLAFRSGNRLCGIAPLFLLHWECRAQLTFIGNGVSDYLGLVAEPELAAQCADLAMCHIADDSLRWDLCDFQDLAADCAFLNVAAHGLELRYTPHTPCMRASLSPDPEVSNSAVAAYLLRNIRSSRQHLDKIGRVEFATSGTASADLVTELVQLHRSRWADSGGPKSMLDTPQSVNLLCDAANAFGASGRLRVYTMRLDQRLVAGIYAFLDARILWGYFTGFDRALARYSPGSLLLDYARTEAVRDGAVTWDFLRGAEPYKEHWGAVEVPKYRLTALPMQEHRESRQYASEHV